MTDFFWGACYCEQRKFHLEMAFLSLRMRQRRGAAIGRTDKYLVRRRLQTGKAEETSAVVRLSGRPRSQRRREPAHEASIFGLSTGGSQVRDE